MKRRYFPLLAALALCGCVVNIGNRAATGPMEHETRSIDKDNAERVHADLHMSAGELRVSGGAPNLMTADFAYNVAAWKPDVRYTNVGGRGNLTLDQPKGGAHGNAKNTWDLRFNDDVPIDLSMQLGAGEARMDLGMLDLRSVDLQMGVGEMKMDLRGNPKHDYDVHVRGGVGEATIYVPATAGIYATAAGGIGGVEVTGLRKVGSHWESDSYQSAKTQIHLDVSGGVGEIKIIAE